MYAVLMRNLDDYNMLYQIYIYLIDYQLKYLKNF